MKAAPANRPDVLVTLSHGEAAAIVRALTRAARIARDAGNTLDLERLQTMRECIEGALAGGETSAEVEP